MDDPLLKYEKQYEDFQCLHGNPENIFACEVLSSTCPSSVSISRCSVRKGQRLCFVGGLQRDIAVDFWKSISHCDWSGIFEP